MTAPHPVASRGINSHHSSRMGTDEWLTPPGLLKTLGHFDLDPCSPINRPWPTADHHLTVLDDGLKQPWCGRVWLNPPYGRQTSLWLKRLADHGHGVALVFARTETATWFDHIWPKAEAILFLKGRIKFCRVDGRPARGNCGGPLALVAYGVENTEALWSANMNGFSGKLIQLK